MVTKKTSKRENEDGSVSEATTYTGDIDKNTQASQTENKEDLSLLPLALEEKILEFDVANVEILFPTTLQTFLASQMGKIDNLRMSGQTVEIKNTYDWCIEQAAYVYQRVKKLHPEIFGE